MVFIGKNIAVLIHTIEIITITILKKRIEEKEKSNNLCSILSEISDK